MQSPQRQKVDIQSSLRSCDSDGSETEAYENVGVSGVDQSRDGSAQQPYRSLRNLRLQERNIRHGGFQVGSSLAARWFGVL